MKKSKRRIHFYIITESPLTLNLSLQNRKFTVRWFSCVSRHRLAFRCSHWEKARDSRQYALVSRRSLNVFIGVSFGEYHDVYVMGFEEVKNLVSLAQRCPSETYVREYRRIASRIASFVDRRNRPLVSTRPSISGGGAVVGRGADENRFGRSGSRQVE